MNTQISPSEMIERSREILLLLSKGERAKALEKIEALDNRLQSNPTELPIDIEALWELVGIAAGSPDNVRYLDEVKEELNRVSFDHK